MKLDQLANYQKLIKYGVAIASIMLVTACNSQPQQSALPLKTSTLPSLPTKIPFKSITLERTECYGHCPVYTVTVLANGKVSYDGRKYVKVTGKVQSTLNKAKIQLLEEAIAEANFFNFKDKYRTIEDGCGMVATDGASTETIIVIEGKKKSVDNYTGCEKVPIELTQLENKIDKIVNTVQWIGKKS